jgi:hypothetical protein
MKDYKKSLKWLISDEVEVVYENLDEEKQGLAHESSMGNYFKCLFIVQRLSLVQTKWTNVTWSLQVIVLF